MCNPPLRLSPFPHRGAPASPAAAACPRSTGRPPPSPPWRQRPGLTAGRARGRGFPAMALSLSDPGSLRGPPGPGRARGPFNGGGPARPAARARPAPRPRSLAARPEAALSHWLRAPRPRAPIGWRRGAASPAASCFKVTLSGGRRGQASPAPQPRPDWPPRLLFKRLKRLAGEAADWPARLSITAVAATPLPRGAGPHVREARRERARSDPGIPEIWEFLEICQSNPLPRQGDPEQVTQGQLQTGQDHNNLPWNHTTSNGLDLRHHGTTPVAARQIPPGNTPGGHGTDSPEAAFPGHCRPRIPALRPEIPGPAPAPNPGSQTGDPRHCRPRIPALRPEIPGHCRPRIPALRPEIPGPAPAPNPGSQTGDPRACPGPESRLSDRRSPGLPRPRIPALRPEIPGPAPAPNPGSQTGDPRALPAPNPGSQTGDPRALPAPNPGSQTGDPRACPGPESRLSDRRSLGTAGPESRLSDRRSLGTAGPESRLSDRRSPGTAGPESRLSDRRSPGTAGPESRLSDRRSPGLPRPGIPALRPEIPGHCRPRIPALRPEIPGPAPAPNPGSQTGDPRACPGPESRLSDRRSPGLPRPRIPALRPEIPGPAPAPPPPPHPAPARDNGPLPVLSPVRTPAANQRPPPRARLPLAGQSARAPRPSQSQRSRW
ncbi:basic proline-rich protein-like [Sylvia atricapilla]|uniref:basic proline-rich protein-like n=1 Tax=Sylvia atricapilla TaxID=48155 RepID=UPI0033930497